MQIVAHGGEAVRAVGFVIDEGGRTWVISGGEDATLRSWDLENLEFQSFQLLDHPIYDLEVSADGSFAVTGEGDWNGGPGSDTLRIWDADDILLGTIPADQITGTTAPIGFVYCVAISPDNLWTVASGFYGDFVVYDTSSLDDPVVTKKTKIKRTKALAFSPDGNILASTSTAGRIQLWSFPKDKCDSFSCELERHTVSLSHGGSWVFPIAFAPYSIPGLTEIVSGSDGGMIKLWRFDLSAPPPDDPDFAVDSGAVYSLAYSPPDGSMIVAGGNGDITVYNADNLDILFHFVNAHDGRVNDVAFSPYGPFIVSGGADGALKLWDLGAQ
jgi:WD40 repeat protein